jgi:hypothetical protein
MSKLQTVRVAVAIATKRMRGTEILVRYSIFQE